MLKSLHRHGFRRFSRIYFYKLYFFLRALQFNLAKEHLVNVNGCKLLLLPNDKGISREIFVFGSHEPLHTELLTKELKEGMTCIDIGSNIGYYAVLESKLVGQKGKVICIEPSPINFTHLKKNLQLQNNSNTEPYNFACGDVDGKIKFLVSNFSNWSRVVTNDECTPINDKTLKKIDVQMRKLDSFLTELSLPKVDLVRMDIEGYEYQAYEGMIKTLEKFSPMLIIEFHKFVLGMEKTIELLLKFKKNGYEIKYYFPRYADRHFIGNMNDVEKLSFSELFKTLDDKNPIFNGFTLFLTKNHK